MASELLHATARKIESNFIKRINFLEWEDLPDDPWGRRSNINCLSAKEARLISDGRDKTANTVWDLGINITVKKGRRISRVPGFEEKKGEGLSWKTPEAMDLNFNGVYGRGWIDARWGGLLLVLYKIDDGTVVLFIPFAMLYKPRTYLR